MKYPYYIVPDVERFKQLDPHSSEAEKLSRIISANIGDPASLRRVLGIDPPGVTHFYSEMEKSTPSTFDTIDSFLDKFGANIPSPDILNEDASGYVSENEDVAKPEMRKDDFRELVKQHRYQEALMLIEEQNLNNPQKSIYFAHQMRFLKKLIAIENYRNKTQG